MYKNPEVGASLLAIPADSQPVSFRFAGFNCRIEPVENTGYPMKKRNLFEELMQGVDEMAAQREGKITLCNNRKPRLREKHGVFSFKR